MLRTFAIFLFLLMVFLPAALAGQGPGEAFFCCLDLRIPNISPWVFLPAILIFVAIFVVASYTDQRPTQEKKEWVGVEIIWEDPDRIGVVVDQIGENLYINFLNERGGISQVMRKISEVRRKNYPL